ncbi:efflux RND transporter periplasmic adaptor subunit [Tenacibaculum aestuariivivum]|uniref:efflux RND transporter periplasmic adaptor subunit n=1 Tax=Tenacibaculum aestuariivivum TaxID=2006131 RepID=UPI003AB6DD54
MQRTLYKILILLFILFGCNSNKVENEKKSIEELNKNIKNQDNKLLFVSKKQFDYGKMILGSIEDKLFPVLIKTSGLIDVPPQNKAVVYAQMGGYIKNTPLLIGDKIHRGQALVTLENPDFIRIQQEYMELNEQLIYLKSEFERQKTMFAENITSQKNFLQSQSIYKAAKARHNGLRKQLEMLHIAPASVAAGNISTIVTVNAPITGNISKINVTQGTYVSPASVILEIINNNNLHIELSVFEKDILNLQKGQKINFKIPESSNQIYEAKIHLIGTVIEDNSRTIKVYGDIKNKDATNLITGMFVEASIVISSSIEKSLPETAVVVSEKDYNVLKLVKKNDEGYYFDVISVKVGKTNNKFVSLKSFKGIKDTDKILIKGAFNLIGE